MSITQLGSTAIGIQIESGVVLAVEKRIGSSLLIPSSIQKILEIDSRMLELVLLSTSLEDYRLFSSIILRKIFVCLDYYTFVIYFAVIMNFF